VLLVAGCSTPGKFTRLTPNQQFRNPSNMYTVETAFNSQKQVLRWDSIRAFVIVDGHALPMREVPMVKGRWEGEVPVPPGVNTVSYRFKFDYLANSFGSPKPVSEQSQIYTLQVVEQ
jgi:hypothetical protein